MQVESQKLCPVGYRGRLEQAMYGTRRASFLWQEEAARTLTESKQWVRLATCGQVFYNAEHDAFCAIHGDDFAPEGEPPMPDNLDDPLDKNFICKRLPRVGPQLPARAGI